LLKSEIKSHIFDQYFGITIDQSLDFYSINLSKSNCIHHRNFFKIFILQKIIILQIPFYQAAQ